jgi:hypothetical protein
MIESDKKKAIEKLNDPQFDFFPEETKEKVRQGVWYGHAGLLRGMMTKEFPKKFAEYQAEKRYKNPYFS